MFEVTNFASVSLSLMLSGVMFLVTNVVFVSLMLSLMMFEVCFLCCRDVVTVHHGQTV